jgi:hypothetical protein
LSAWQDITFIVDAIYTTVSDVRVYDPYYCHGGTKELLSVCGFKKEFIFNDPVNCYSAQREKSVPLHDILLSNPPYSGEHIRRALHYAVSTSKPWAFLLPSYVFLRPWFQEEIGGQNILYLAPHQRYSFLSNQGETPEPHIPYVTMVKQLKM